MIKSLPDLDLFQDPEFVKLTQILAEDPELSVALSVLLLSRLSLIIKRCLSDKRAWAVDK